MKFTRILWISVGIIVIGWIYFLYLSPRIFKPVQRTVPNILGLSEEEAAAELERNKILYRIHYIDGESFCVDSTMPKYGSRIYESYTVEVYIQKPLPKYYQSFVGLLYDENIERISSYCNTNHLKFRVEYVIDNSVKSGQIIGQSKAPDEILEAESEIVFQVAVSDDYVSMPNLSGMHIDEAMKLLDSYGLRYNVIYYNAPLEQDIVISQSLTEGSIIKKGNAYNFDIYVSKGMPHDLASINIEDFIAVLHDLSYPYRIVYVDSMSDAPVLAGISYGKEFILYITK